MCNPALWIQGGMAALSLVGGAKQAKGQTVAADEDADNMELQGAYAADRGVAEAQRTRRAGRQARGAVLGAYGASGVKIGEGSALDIERETMQDYEQDAMMAILEGRQQQSVARRQAAMRRYAGRSAGAASALGSAGPLMQYGGSLMSRGAGG